MPTLLISGADTGIGKTRVTGILAALLPEAGETVQIVKPVETGVSDGTQGDAETASTIACKPDGPIESRTLFRFPDPVAPVAAAWGAGTELKAAGIAAAINRLPVRDWRLIEGAGGLAVPLEANGFDWADLAAALGMIHVVLVISDRLGAINQARLTAHYARSRGLPFSLWLNETNRQPDAIRRSNRIGIMESGLSPVFHLNHNANVPEAKESVREFYRNIRSPLKPTDLEPSRNQSSAAREQTP